MLKRQRIDQANTPDGRTLELCRRGDDYFIDIDRWELMSSRDHGSEQTMVRLATEALRRRPQARWLVGGLGMGFTLRACLDAMAACGGREILVAEVFQAVVGWNRGPLADLAGRPLDDPRVQVVLGDVYDQLEPTAPFGVILLDVDNGPEALTLESNQRLYKPAGLQRLRGALASDGVLAIWSAGDDEAFRRRLRKAGFNVQCKRARSRPDGKGLRHTVFLATPR